MSVMFECGDNAALVSYLYGECGAEEHAAVTAHLAICGACAAEVAALRATRGQLAAWAPPAAQLGFRVASEARPATVLRPARWWQRPTPGWLQAAAAVALFGIGLSLGVMRGRTPDGPAAATATVASQGAPPAVNAADLQALEQRLRTELAQMRAEPVAREVSAPASSEAQILARVRALIEESEQRQRRELALRTAEIVRDVDAQRQVDWARVQRAMGQFEGTAGAELQRQRQEINNLIRVSQQPR
jgi:hypothetical protein